MIDSHSSKDVSSFYDRLIQLAHQAIRKAQQESRDLGVPNVYSFNGQLFYELPSGELSLTRPERTATDAKRKKSGDSITD